MSLFINLCAKIQALHCISAQTDYIALAMEFAKLQIISKHFKGGNRDSEYMLRVRQQHKINLKLHRTRDELSHGF